MNNLIFSIVITFISVFYCQAQNLTFLSDKEIAGGDTAMYLGSKTRLTKNQLGDTLQQYITKGIHRFVINQNIPKEDFLMTVMNEQGQKIEVVNQDNYLEFYNSDDSFIEFVLNAKDAAILELDDNELIGRLFYVYHKNVLKETPSFSLIDTEGNKHTNETLKGKIVIFNFWHTRCTPCIKELPQLNALVEKYADEDNVVFIAVTPNTKEVVDDFLLKRDFKYQHVVKTYDLKEQFIEEQAGWPSHVVVNKDGKMIFQYVGAPRDIEETLTEIIEKNS